MTKNQHGLMISIINISQQQKDGIRLQPIIDELPDGYALFRERERALLSWQRSKTKSR